MNKHYISAQQLLEDSFRLAAAIYQSGFRPDFIVGIWRGGAPVGIAVQEFFEFKGVTTDHIAVRTSSYTGIGKQAKSINVHGLHYLLENISRSTTLLIIDDVFDSGRSIEALLAQLEIKAQDKLPEDIRVGCPWYKPSNSKVDLQPDYYVHQTDQWLVFPHELSGLTLEEIRQGKQELTAVHQLLFDDSA